MWIKVKQVFSYTLAILLYSIPVATIIGIIYAAFYFSEPLILALFSLLISLIVAFKND